MLARNRQIELFLENFWRHHSIDSLTYGVDHLTSLIEGAGGATVFDFAHGLGEGAISIVRFRLF